MRLSLILPCFALAAGGTVQATSFVVPDDAELIRKSRAIVIGTVEGSFTQEEESTIVTVYEVRIERALKGFLRAAEIVRVASPGGVIGDHGLLVPSAPHFSQGDRVLLFLDRASPGRWSTVDLTLGKFRFVTSTTGDHLLVRDVEDVVGWDLDGQEHHESLRREDGFLRFIEERIRGRAAEPDDYTVNASEVTLPRRPNASRFRVAANAPFPAATYTDWVNSQPIRWPNITAGVTFYKRVDQNIAGAADGGVSVIQNGLAAWTNECGSVINLIYGGTTSTISANFDTVHVVEFNDPQGRISGSWTGSGTIAITFLSFADSHSFAGQTWWNITDADVVFQDGFPATHSAFATAMTHELGHAVGWRHSNQDYATGGACNASTQECTSAAIMNSTVSSAYGYTLQQWDVNAAQSVYPGGSCGGAALPAPVIHATATTTTSVTITWNALSGAAGYDIFRSVNNGPYSQVGQSTGTSFVDNTVSANTSYLYKVRGRDGGGNPGPLSALDPATTVIFTDDPLVAGSTRIKAIHITQLRTAVNALRAAAGLSAATFTDPSPAGVLVKAIHITELRTALNQARTKLGLNAIAFTDSTITPGSTRIKAVHLTEIRAGVK